MLNGRVAQDIFSLSQQYVTEQHVFVVTSKHYTKVFSRVSYVRKTFHRVMFSAKDVPLDYRVR